jgi:hypothetical protein
MAFSVISYTGGVGTLNSVTSSVIDTSGANLIVVTVAWYSGVGAGGNIGILTDNKSNTWTPLTRRTSASQTDNQLFYVVNPIVGTGHTFDFTNSTPTNIYPSIQIGAWSSGSASAAFDQENGATAVGVLSLATGNLTPTQNNEIVVSGMQIDLGGGTQANILIDSGFSLASANFYSSGNEGGAMGYLFQTTAATVNPTWDVGLSSGSPAMAVSIASFMAVVAVVGGRALVNAGLVNRGLVSAGLVN